MQFIEMRMLLLWNIFLCIKYITNELTNYLIMYMFADLLKKTSLLLCVAE